MQGNVFIKERFGFLFKFFFLNKLAAFLFIFKQFLAKLLYCIKCSIVSFQTRLKSLKVKSKQVSVKYMIISLVIYIKQTSDTYLSFKKTY